MRTYPNLSELSPAAGNQRVNAPPVSVLSLFFLCFASGFSLIIRARNLRFSQVFRFLFLGRPYAR
jgi:hypothetical protein